MKGRMLKILPIMTKMLKISKLIIISDVVTATLIEIIKYFLLIPDVKLCESCDCIFCKLFCKSKYIFKINLNCYKF
uniref:Putative secreted protein n=1 Tax=Xenopsylla cheopis TaxID=163159 RepID=A0A6M2DZJ3_XENCH